MIGPEQFVESLTITVRNSVQELALPPVIARSFVVRCHVHIGYVAKTEQKGSMHIEPYSSLATTYSEQGDNNTVAML